MTKEKQTPKSLENNAVLERLKNMTPEERAQYKKEMDQAIHPKTPPLQAGAGGQAFNPTVSKPFKCGRHGLVDSNVFSVTKRTPYSIEVTDIVHCCPHCYVQWIAMNLGVPVENPKAIIELADNEKDPSADQAH